jgi:hypothetical protein
LTRQVTQTSPYSRDGLYDRFTIHLAPELKDLKDSYLKYYREYNSIEGRWPNEDGYLKDDQSLCSILLSAGKLVGIVALDSAAQSKVTWDGLSDVGRRARKLAHGTPALLWLDVPLDGTGAIDFKSLLKAKLARVA